MTNPYGHDGRPDFIDTEPSSASNLEPRDPLSGQSEVPRHDSPEWAARRVQPAPGGQWQPESRQPFQTSSPAPQAEHPKSMTVLILGILGFLLWIPGIIGWIIGGKAKKDIQQGIAPYPWDGALRAGYTLSVLSTVIYLVSFLLLAGLVALIVAVMP